MPNKFTDTLLPLEIEQEDDVTSNYPAITQEETLLLDIMNDMLNTIEQTFDVT
jgi:hypothetical protein